MKTKDRIKELNKNIRLEMDPFAQISMQEELDQLQSLNVQGEGWRTGIPTKTGDYIVMFKNGNVFKYRFDSDNPKVMRQYKWKSIAYWIPLPSTPEEKGGEG